MFILTEKKIKDLRSKLKSTIDEAWEASLQEPDVIPSVSGELADVYAESRYPIVEPSLERQSPKRFVNALSDGLRQAMQHDPTLVLM